MSGSGKPSVKRGALVFYAHLSNDGNNKQRLSYIKTHEKWSKTLDCENNNTAVVGGVGEFLDTSFLICLIFCFKDYSEVTKNSYLNTAKTGRRRIYSPCFLSC